jgi:hypothetical protein
MTQSNKKLKYEDLNIGDVLWIPSKDVLSIVAEPFLSGRSGRMLQLRTEDKDIFDKFFKYSVTYVSNNLQER